MSSAANARDTGSDSRIVASSCDSTLFSGRPGVGMSPHTTPSTSEPTQL